MGGEGCENAARNSAVAVGFARPEHGVGFIHHHNHGAKRAYRHEDPRLLALSVADPFGTELTHLHHRQRTLAGEAVG